MALTEYPTIPVSQSCHKQTTDETMTIINTVMQVRNYWPRFIYKKAIFKSHLTVIKCVSNNSTQRMGTNFLICQLF